MNLANSLDPNRFSVIWVSCEGSASLRPLLSQAVVTQLLDLHHPLFSYLLQSGAYQKRSWWLWTKILGDHALRLLRPLWSLARAVDRSAIDVVVSNSAGVTLGAAYGLIMRKPHVWLVKECMDINVAACRRFTSIMAGIGGTIVATSRAVAAAFPRPVVVYHDGSNASLILDDSRWTSRDTLLRRLGLPPDRLVVGQAGGIVPLKGQHIAAEAFVHLSKRVGGAPYSMLFLGQADPGYRDKIVRILAGGDCDWEQSVRFVQYDPDDYSYLAACDIVIQPSVLPDSLPNSVREAMILGKPVVGSRCGGIPEMISHGQTGLLVQPNDAEELTGAIWSLISVPSERRKLGEAAKEFALRHFDVKSCKQNFEECFLSVSSKRSSNLFVSSIPPAK